MSTRIGGTAANRREHARQGDGRFGQQEYARASGVDLDGEDWMVPIEATPDSLPTSGVDDPEPADAPLSEGVSMGDGAFFGAETTIGAHTQVGENTQIGDGCTIGRNVQIGENTQIGEGVSIGDDCVIDDGATIQGGVTLEDSHIGGCTTVGGLTEIRNSTVGENCEIANDCRLTGSQEQCYVGDRTHLGAFTTLQDTAIGKDCATDQHSRLADCELGRHVRAGGTFDDVQIGDRSTVRAGHLDSLQIGKRVTMEGTADSRIRGESTYPTGGGTVGDGTVMKGFRAENVTLEVGENVRVDGEGQELLLTGGVSIADDAEVLGDVQLGDSDDVALDEHASNSSGPVFDSTDMVCVEKEAHIVGGRRGEKSSLFDVGESYRTVIRGGGTTIGTQADIARGVHIDRDVQVGDESRIAARTLVGEGTMLGGGTVTLYSAQIGPAVELEEGVEIGEQVRVGGDTIVDEGTRIADRVEIGARVRIGRLVTISRGAHVADFEQLDAYTVVDR